MRLAILTTETVHHARFVGEMAIKGHTVLTVAETDANKAAFETSHPFECEREDYEKQVWFAGTVPPFGDFGSVMYVPSVNCQEVLEALKRFRPELAVDFGTGKVKNEIIEFSADRIVNLHGGDPERYRGLDTHLWAIYHREFSGLITTLHRLAPQVDCGDIVVKASVPIPRGARLMELRHFNTEICIELTSIAIEMIRQNGHLLSHCQPTVGRYYSFMPAVLKDLCVKRFERFTQQLNG